jgi:hypothetical protein
MKTLTTLFEETNKSVYFLLCEYYDNGYVDWETHTTREEAMNEGQYGVDWCVVRYNWKSQKYSVVYAEGRTFPVNILCPPYSCGGLKPVVTSVPNSNLPSLVAHYEDDKPISHPPD